MKYEIELEKFLRANRCYTEFMKAIRLKSYKSLEEYCDFCDARHYIISGISWDSGKKGPDFWIALNKKWRNGG